MTIKITHESYRHYNYIQHNASKSHKSNRINTTVDSYAEICTRASIYPFSKENRILIGFDLSYNLLRNIILVQLNTSHNSLQYDEHFGSYDQRSCNVFITKNKKYLIKSYRSNNMRGGSQISRYDDTFGTIQRWRSIARMTGTIIFLMG